MDPKNFPPPAHSVGAPSEVVRYPSAPSKHRLIPQHAVDLMETQDRERAIERAKYNNLGDDAVAALTQEQVTEMWTQINEEMPGASDELKKARFEQKLEVVRNIAKRRRLFATLGLGDPDKFRETVAALPDLDEMDRKARERESEAARLAAEPKWKKLARKAHKWLKRKGVIR